MGLTEPCSSYSSVLLNAAVACENSRSRRSWQWRIPFSSAASSAGCRFVFGRWRKRSIAPNSSARYSVVVRVGSAPTTILCKSIEHTFVCQLTQHVPMWCGDAAASLTQDLHRRLVHEQPVDP